MNKFCFSLQNSCACEGTLNTWKNVLCSAEDSAIVNCVGRIRSAHVDLSNLVCINGHTSKREATCLRPIFLLSSWGIMIGVWYLCKLHKNRNTCRLEIRLGNMCLGRYENNLCCGIYSSSVWESDDTHSVCVKDGIEDLQKDVEEAKLAVSCPIFLQILEDVYHVCFEDEVVKETEDSIKNKIQTVELNVVSSSSVDLLLTLKTSLSFEELGTLGVHSVSQKPW